jgi:hypothetical protein
VRLKLRRRMIGGFRDEEIYLTGFKNRGIHYKFPKKKLDKKLVEEPKRS